MKKNYNVGADNPRWKGGTYEKKCAGCGVQFTPKDHPNRTKYCSIRCSKMRDRNPNWANGGESFTGIHNWGRYNIPKPDLCQCCGKEPPRDLANISNEYKKEVSDWEWLCRACHMTKDNRMNNLRHPIVLRAEKSCPCCGKQFRPKTKGNVYCSRACYLSHFFTDGNYRCAKNKPSIQP